MVTPEYLDKGTFIKMVMIKIGERYIHDERQRELARLANGSTLSLCRVIEAHD